MTANYAERVHVLVTFYMGPNTTHTRKERETQMDGILQDLTNGDEDVKDIYFQNDSLSYNTDCFDLDDLVTSVSNRSRGYKIEMPPEDAEVSEEVRKMAAELVGAKKEDSTFRIKYQIVKKGNVKEFISYHGPEADKMRASLARKKLEAALAILEDRDCFGMVRHGISEIAKAL